MSKILIVDDENSIRITFSKFLTNEGHNVKIAENVEKALKIVKHDKFDMIITDIIMPRESGMILLKKVHEIDSEISVIVITGEPSVETVTESLRYHVDDYLQKPINKVKLINTVNKALRNKQILDEKNYLEKENKKYRTELENLVLKRTIKLQEIMKGTIEAISAMIEIRDPYTAGHDKRMGNLSVKISKKMGLDKETLDGINIAGRLHDIGKISVPAEILSKPGKLTKLEFDIIKTHAECSYNILKNIEFPWPVADIVYKHHERLDGSGYPRGLTSADLGISERILMVADVIEAMLSHRPYRPALGMDVVINELEKNSGIKYDEKVVATALSIITKDKFKLDDSNFKVDFDI